MTPIKFKTVTDRHECETLWKMFSPNRDFWDLWEVRECFLTTNSQLHFIVGYLGDEVIGVLPLCLNKEKGFYSWIGYEFPEHNKILMKNKSDLKYFIDHAPEKLCMVYIDRSEKDVFSFQWGEEKYFLDTEKFKNIDEYLHTFSKKHRSNLKRDIKALMEAGYQVHFNDYDSDILLDLIEKYNIERFGKDSSFAERGYKESMRNLMKFAKKMGILHIISISKNKIAEAAEFAIFYKGIYIVIIGGYNPKISNLGKVLIHEHISNAFRLKAKKLDFMAGSDEWKKLWNFSTEGMYEFIRFKTKCMECIYNQNTCCEGHCTRFVTLHDLLRISKLGYNIDQVAVFDRMQDWEIAMKKDGKGYCDFYDLAIDNCMLMLKKGDGKCLFLDSNHRCKIYAQNIFFCKVFPFWFVRKNGEIKIILDPWLDECRVCDAHNVEAINQNILDGKFDLDDSYFSKTGTSKEVLLSQFKLFEKELKAYEQYRHELAKGKLPSQVIQQYNIHL